MSSSDTEISSFRLRKYACPTTVLPSLVKVYGSMYVSKAMNILLKVLRVKNLDGLFDPASEVSGVIPNLY